MKILILLYNIIKKMIAKLKILFIIEQEEEQKVNENYKNSEYIKKFKKVYEIVKKEYWPYRYYILLTILFLISFTLDMLTIYRINRFIITLVFIYIYKILYNYINKKNIKYFNIKYVLWLMRFNIIVNPLLYLVWKWDLNIYKIKDLLNLKIKNKKVRIFMISLCINISTPIRIIYVRYCNILLNFQKYTLFQLLFIRIYGLLLSILIFSNIIQYVLKLTGGYLYLIIDCYLILYIINVMYTCYILIKGKSIINIESNIKIVFKKTYIYRFLENYFYIFQDNNIIKIYNIRNKVTLSGYYLEKNLLYYFNTNKFSKLINLDIYQIITIWRFYIYQLGLTNEWYYVNSYIDCKKQLILVRNIDININMNILYFIYYNVYHKLMYNLENIIIIFESMLYYKYSTDVDNFNKLEYQNAYKLYILILKNLLHFIWSFEFNFYQNKNKITKLNIIEDIDLEYGYHIYSKEKNNYNSYKAFEPLFTFNEYVNKPLNKFNDEKYDKVYESIHLLYNLEGYNILNICLLYVNYKDNISLKNIHFIFLKYKELFQDKNSYDNDLTLLKKEKAKEYFNDLKIIITDIKKEWEELDTMDIFEKRTVFYELTNHIELWQEKK